MDVLLQCKRLTTKKCCEYDDLMYEKKDYCFGKDETCYLFNDRPFRCKWFEQAVLPLKQKLEAAYYKMLEIEEKTEKTKPCERCGDIFFPRSNRQVYCDDCKGKHRREYQTNHKKEQRKK